MSHRQLEAFASLALIATTIAVLLILLAPGERLGSEDGAVRSISERQSWLIHSIMFGVLGGLSTLRPAAARTLLPAPRRLWIAALLLLTLATATELAQLGIDGRGAALGDWIADLTGALLGLTAGARWSPRIVARITAGVG